MKSSCVKNLVFSLVALASVAQAATEADLRKALATKTGRVVLPEGTFEISREIVLPADAHDLTGYFKGAFR